MSKRKRFFNVKSTYYFHVKTKILADFQTCISVLSGVDKFLSRRSTFREHNFICAPNRARTQKMGGQSQDVRPIQAQLETFLFVPYYLNMTCSFDFNCASIKNFCNEAFVVWMLF